MTRWFFFTFVWIRNFVQLCTSIVPIIFVNKHIYILLRNRSVLGNKTWSEEAFKIISPFSEDFDPGMLHTYPPPINVYICIWYRKGRFLSKYFLTLSLIFLFVNDVAFENIGFHNEFFMLQPPGIDTTPQSKNYSWFIMHAMGTHDKTTEVFVLYRFWAIIAN